MDLEELFIHRYENEAELQEHIQWVLCHINKYSVAYYHGDKDLTDALQSKSKREKLFSVSCCQDEEGQLLYAVLYDTYAMSIILMIILLCVVVVVGGGLFLFFFVSVLGGQEQTPWVKATGFIGCSTMFGGLIASMTYKLMH